MLTESGELNAETMERAQRWLTERVATKSAPLHPERGRDLTVREVVEAFKRDRATFASSNEQNGFACALRPVVELYGSTPAHQFGPLALRAVRQRMIDGGNLNRKTLNERVKRIKAAFRWAAGLEMVPPSVPEALGCVEGIRAGRVEGLREPGKVSAVEDEHVDAVLPHLSRQVAAIVEFMRATGARCGEVVQLRPCDVDRSREPWVYTPQSHKTQHHGHTRKVYLGPRARVVLSPWLLRADDAPCFQPCEAEAELRAALSEARTTPEGQGNRPGYSARSRAGREAKKAPGETYTTASVGRAISRACERAGAPPPDRRAALELRKAPLRAAPPKNGSARSSVSTTLSPVSTRLGEAQM